MKAMPLTTAALAAMLASGLALAQTAPASGPLAKLDANGDGVIDRSEAAKAPRLAARFDALDRNHDGKLDASELAAARAAAGKPGMHRGGMGARWQALDANHDGRISRSEAQADPAFLARFDVLDVNKDGYVDRTDMQLRMQQKRAEFFAAADTNKDGKLSFDEFVVEQGARRQERMAQWQQRAQAAGKPARPAPDTAQQVQRARMLFDRMDANHDGVVTRAEYDAFRPGMGKHAGKPAAGAAQG